MVTKKSNLTFKSAAAAVQSMLEILNCPACGEGNMEDLRVAKMQPGNFALVAAFCAMCDKLDGMLTAMRDTGICILPRDEANPVGGENK